MKIKQIHLENLVYLHTVHVQLELTVTVRVSRGLESSYLGMTKLDFQLLQLIEWIILPKIYSERIH